MGLLRVTKFAYLHITDPRYVLCEDTVEILQYVISVVPIPAVVVPVLLLIRTYCPCPHRGTWESSLPIGPVIFINVLYLEFSVS